MVMPADPANCVALLQGRQCPEHSKESYSQFSTMLSGPERGNKEMAQEAGSAHHHVGTVVVPHLGQLELHGELVVHAGDEVVGLADVAKEVEATPRETRHDGVRLAATTALHSQDTH